VRFLYLPRVLANMSLGGISDANRIAALGEVRRAQRTHLGLMHAERQYLVLSARYRMRRICELGGLNRLIAWQRTVDRGMRTVGDGPEHV
jgi:hypothetical protein